MSNYAFKFNLSGGAKNEKARYNFKRLRDDFCR